MNSIKILIVEDEPIIAADLENQLQKMGYTIIGNVDMGKSAIAIVQDHKPDLILMDIQLEGDLDGVDTAHQIEKICNAPIIFLTSNTDDRTFARAKLTNPFAFLSKPFRTTDLKRSIELATLSIENKEEKDLEKEEVDAILEDRIFIRNKSALQKVMLEDISYVEADGAYCKVVAGDRQFVISYTLKRFEEEVRHKHLIRVHRSFMINVIKVDQIADGFVLLLGHKIPVGRSHKDRLHKYFRSL